MIKSDLKFTLTFEDIREALEANGWHTQWHEDNWVPPNSSNPDWDGHTITDAFATLMRDKNITSYQRGLEIFWT